MESSAGSDVEVVGNTLEEVEQKLFGGVPSNGSSARPKAVFGLPGGAATPEGAQSPPRTIFESITRDYYEVLDNPKRLPIVFHPFISKEKEVSTSVDKNFISHEFYLADEHKVPRKMVLNMQIENLAVGATGGLLIGIGTHTFFAENQVGFIQQAFKAVKTTENTTGKPFSKLMTGSLVTWRISKQAALGALLYDCLKRTSEMKGDEDDWKHSAFAGAVCGGLFGLRGGPPGMIVGSAAFCGLAGIQLLAPKLFKSIS